jgi:alcohol dehydrogenase class IV
MGYNLANSSTCLPHRLQYPIGARTGTAHGLGLAALFPSWIRTTRYAAPDRFAVVAGWIGEGLGRSVDDIDEALCLFMNRIDLRPELQALGVRQEDIPTLTAETTGSLENDPWWSDSADLEVILEGAMRKGNQ